MDQAHFESKSGATCWDGQVSMSVHRSDKTGSQQSRVDHCGVQYRIKQCGISLEL